MSETVLHLIVISFAVFVCGSRRQQSNSRYEADGSTLNRYKLDGSTLIRYKLYGSRYKWRGYRYKWRGSRSKLRGYRCQFRGSRSEWGGYGYKRRGSGSLGTPVALLLWVCLWICLCMDVRTYALWRKGGAWGSKGWGRAAAGCARIEVVHLRDQLVEEPVVLDHASKLRAAEHREVQGGGVGHRVATPGDHVHL